MVGVEGRESLLYRNGGFPVELCDESDLDERRGHSFRRGL